VFLEHFSYRYAKTWDGVRQDSGDAKIIGEKVINHYLKLGIDPLTKSIMFSDNLDISKSLLLHKYFKDRIQPLFGIGTNLTHNIPHIKPVSIVIKMVECNGLPVAKISDEQGKNTCENPQYLEYLKSIYGVK
jgi:nicotinate phosphoribosyltransferase